MAKNDVRQRMLRGIQPGLAPIPQMMENNQVGAGIKPNMPIGAMESMGMPFGANPVANSNPMGFAGPKERIDPSSLLAPSFESVMNQNPNMENSVKKRAIGTRASLMNKFNSGY